MTHEEAKKMGATHYMNITEILEPSNSGDRSDAIFNYHRCVNGVWQFLESPYWLESDESDCEINEKFLNNLKPL